MYKSKKAFGGVASTLIMFIAIVGISTGLVISFKNYISEAQASFDFQNDLTVSKLKTAMSVTHVTYNESVPQVIIYLKNIGESKLRPTKFDLFIDEAYISDFSTLHADNFSQEMTLQSPQQTVAIVKNISLAQGSHDIRIVTELGVGVEDSFNN